MAAGVVAGLLAGLLGVGGGIVMVPAMVLVFEIIGISKEVFQHVAVASSLAVIISTGTVSAWAHHKKGAVMVDVLKLWSPFIIVAALIGGLMSSVFSGDALRLVFASVAMFGALNLVLPVQKKIMARLGGSKTVNRISAFVVGYVSALMGIGGGTLSVPTLAAFGNSVHKAVGTSSALGVILAIPATIGFIIAGLDVGGRPSLSLGYVNIPAVLILGIVAAGFAPIGAMIAHRLNQHYLKLGFGLFLLLVAFRMIWQVFY